MKMADNYQPKRLRASWEVHKIEWGGTAMKVVEKYRCEVCYTEYADRKQAEACEKSHKKPAKISGARHLPMAQNGTGYPVSITVKMSDGKEVIYKR